MKRITAKPTKENFKVGKSVYFKSGNFEGLEGLIVRVDWNSVHPNAIFGYYHKIQLSNGNIGYIEKLEHVEVITGMSKTADDLEKFIPDSALFKGKKKYIAVIPFNQNAKGNIFRKNLRD